LERAPFSEKIYVLSFPVLGNATSILRPLAMLAVGLYYPIYNFCAKV
jgi:hypothetical protein